MCVGVDCVDVGVDVVVVGMDVVRLVLDVGCCRLLVLVWMCFTGCYVAVTVVVCWCWYCC